MAVNKVYKFQTITELQYFLNGAVVGAIPPKNSQGPSGWYNLVGKTLVIGGTTVTFTVGVGPDPALLQLSDVKAQVEAAVATVLVTTVEQKLTILQKTPTTGVTVHSTGTANTLLGFDISNDSVGKVFAPPGAASPIAAPSWTWAYSVNENMHVVYTLE